MGPAELRDRRRALRLTQAELGRALGVAANTVARWERGNLAIRHPGLIESAMDQLRGSAYLRIQQIGSGSEPRHNLPVEADSYVGRDQQVLELLRQLDTTRILTLTGPGGVGKTRLALRLARQALSNYTGGVWFVDLAPVIDHSLVPATVASALGVKELPGQSILGTVAAAVANEHLLLVLDNCEHLVQACAELANELVHSGPNLTILATSREALRVPGETIWPVPPLSLLESGSDATLETVLNSEAVQLFLQRACAVKPGFALTCDNFRLVAQVCARLDGLPLALELAAARMNVLGPDQIAARLDDRFALLVRGPRTAHPRQQTLRATLDWSYDLLDLSERRLLNRLAVFAGDCDLEAIETVCAGDVIGSSQVLDLLTSLADKSMVAVSANEPRRYRLLETLRAYARQRLAASCEADRVHALHAAFAADLAERLGTVVSGTGPEAKAALERLRWNADNQRAALRWAIDTGAADIALRLAGALAEVWYRLGSFREGSYWLANVLDIPGASAQTFERAWVLNGAGWLAVCQGEHSRAEALNSESLAIGRMLNDSLLVSRGLINMGVGAHQHGADTTARVRFEEALAIARASSDTAGEAMALRNLSSLAVEVGDYAAAELRGGEALALGRKLRSEWMQAGAMTQLGLAAFGLGRVAGAREILEASLVAARASGDRNFISSSLDALGSVILALGDQRHAAALLRESLQLRYDVGDWPHIPTSVESLARAYATSGQPAKAVRLFATAAGMRATLQRPQTARERAMAELWLPALRHRLGETAFEAAWAAGRSAAVEQVIADTLSPNDDGGSPTISTGSRRLPATNRLTTREREVADLVVRGLSNRQIADELVITERTAENHLRHIFDKLGASSRAQVAAWAVAHGP